MPKSKEARREFDRERQRTQPWRAWYGLPIWKQIRKQQLHAKPLCERCEAKGRVTAATVVNHVDRHRGNWQRFITGPFESLCKSCHDRDAQAEERGTPFKDPGPDGWPAEG
jgi:5-methylcytosine-specific restriction protein A